MSGFVDGDRFSDDVGECEFPCGICGEPVDFAGPNFPVCEKCAEYDDLRARTMDSSCDDSVDSSCDDDFCDVPDLMDPDDLFVPADSLGSLEELAARLAKPAAPPPVAKAVPPRAALPTGDGVVRRIVERADTAEREAMELVAERRQGRRSHLATSIVGALRYVKAALSSLSGHGLLDGVHEVVPPTVEVRALCHQSGAPLAGWLATVTPRVGDLIQMKTLDGDLVARVREVRWYLDGVETAPDSVRRLAGGRVDVRVELT